MLEAVSIQLKIDRFMTAKLFRVRIVHWGGWVRDSCLHYQLAQPLFLEKGEKGEKIGTGRIGGLNGHPSHPSHPSRSCDVSVLSIDL